MSAWKQGHKHKCMALCSRYDAFEKSLKVVDDAHNSIATTTKVGIALSDEFDYLVLSTSVSFGCISKQRLMGYVGYEAGEVEEELGEPSMEFFYDNLGQIVRGEFWFYEKADYTIYREANLTHEAELCYFVCLCNIMCTGLVGVDPDLFRTKFPKNSVAMLGMKFFGEGLAMPASVFLQLYRKGRGSTSSTDRFRLQRENRNDCIRQFIKHLHK